MTNHVIIKFVLKEAPLSDTDTEDSAPEIIKTLPQLIPAKDGELTR